MAAVVLEQVCKEIAGNRVVDDVSLEVRDGEFLVLLGPSGCGKTTTLRMIAGLEEVTSGRIHIDGDLANDVHPSDRDIAMVFQSYALYPHMTIRRNLGYGLIRRGLDRKTVDRMVDEVAASLALDGLLDRKPAQLSGGQRQRVALGRAIIRKPKVFLMDEPLSNLDAKLRVDMRSELIRLQASLGITTIYVTHDQVEAMTMGHRVAIMNAGRLEQLGPPLELFREPRNLFVAAFMGHPGMNLFRGVIDRRDSRATFVGEGIEAVVSDFEPRGEVVLGVRPQHLHVAPPGGGVSSNSQRLGTATVEFVEHLGTESFVSVALGDRRAMAALSSDAAVSAGDTVMLVAATKELHLFDAGTSARVPRTALPERVPEMARRSYP